MSKLQTILLTLAISSTIFALVLILKPQAVPFGSVNYGNSYQSTTTRQASNGTVLTNLTNLCPNGGGILGSIVVTGANTGIINIFNGTTTIHTGYATTTLATIPASAVAGTYTFDITAPLGLIYQLESGLTPTTTITYRCNN